MRKRLTASLAIACASVGVALLAGGTTFGRVTEAQTYDWRLAARPTPARQDVAIVDINESSVRALAPVLGRWPWPRVIHSGVINYLARARARVIVYDVQFTEADAQGTYRIGDRTVSGPESDDELVTAVRRAGNVILLADALFEDLRATSSSLERDTAPSLPGTVYSPGGGLIERPSVRLPFAALRDAAAAVGHNLLVKDPDGVSRSMYPFVASQGVAVPSLGAAAVLLAGQVPSADVTQDGRTLHIKQTAVPLRADGQMLLKLHGPFSTPAGETTFPVYSFFDVLLSEERVASGEAPAVPASAFAGKIVFVGTSASGLADVHATAFGGSTPGVYLQATLADNIQSGNFVRSASTGLAAALVVAVGGVAALATMILSVWWALSLLVGGATVAGWWATHEVGRGLWLPVVEPATAALVATIGGLAWQFFVEGREKRAVKRMFGRYVSPDIFRQLMTDPTLARIGGERRDMSVLFADIRGFTSASEGAAPEDVVAQLNEYFGDMVQVLFRHQGTVDKFVGDMVMGLFGAPLADPHHADHAVAAAIEMSEALERLNARRAAAGLAGLDIGIGINSGEMIAGNIGSESLMSYTVIGDAVNLGSRIESLNKEYGTRILISQATRDQLTTAVATRHLGEITVKGRRTAVSVYEVTRGDRSGART